MNWWNQQITTHPWWMRRPFRQVNNFKFLGGCTNSYQIFPFRGFIMKKWNHPEGYCQNRWFFWRGANAFYKDYERTVHSNTVLYQHISIWGLVEWFIQKVKLDRTLVSFFLIDTYSSGLISIFSCLQISLPHLLKPMYMTIDFSF